MILNKFNKFNKKNFTTITKEAATSNMSAIMCLGTKHSITITVPFSYYIINKCLQTLIDKSGPNPTATAKANITKLKSLLALTKADEKITEVELVLVNPTWERLKKQGKGGFNIQSLEKKQRNLFLREYSEVDIKNCHLVILYNLLLLLEIDTEVEIATLSTYIQDRKSFLENNSEFNEAALKTAVISCMYGGGGSTTYSTKVAHLISVIKKAKSLVIKKMRSLSVFSDMFFYFDEHTTSINIESKIFSKILQYFEKQLLCCILLFFNSKYVIPMHDGVLIPSKNLENVNLEGIEDHIFRETNFKINLVVKGIKSIETESEKASLVPEEGLDLGWDVDTSLNPESVYVDNSLNPETPDVCLPKAETLEVETQVISKAPVTPFKFLTQTVIEKDKDTKGSGKSLTIVHSIMELTNMLGSRLNSFVIKDKNSNIWVKNNNIWTDNKKVVEEVIFRNVFNYGYTLIRGGAAQNMGEALNTFLAIIDTCLKLMVPTKFCMTTLIEGSTQGHIMFSCGTIYNISKKYVVHGSSFYFGGTISISYSEFVNTENQEERVYQILLDIFGGPEEVDYFLYFICSSLTAQMSFWKTSLYIVGERVSGKSLMIKALGYLLGDICLSDLNSNYFTSMKVADNERAHDWASRLYTQRIITVSELDDSRLLNGRLIKKIQGRDIIWARALYSDPKQVQTGSCLIIVNNSVAQPSSPDVLDKFAFIETPNVFKQVDTIEPQGNFKPIDISLEERVKEVPFKVGFLKLIFKNYSTIKREPTPLMKEFQEVVAPNTTEVSVSAWVSKNLSFSDKFTNVLPSSELLDLINKHKKEGATHINLYVVSKYLKSKGITTIRSRSVSGVQFRGYQYVMIKPQFD